MKSTNNIQKERAISVHVVGRELQSGTIHWGTHTSIVRGADEEVLSVDFPLYGEVKKRSALKAVKTLLEKNEIFWIREIKNQWIVNIDKLYKEFSSLKHIVWLQGKVIPDIEISWMEEDIIGENRKVTGKERKGVSVSFIITQKNVELSMTKKIFLSHKGINKSIVEDYYNVLKELGFDPWLDKEALVAGANLERGLLKGMQESCASVFFITPDFIDESYLATEIDYAVKEKRKKGDRFSIITLVFSGQDGAKGTVPDLLERYVHKEPKNNIQALYEIIRALPIGAQQITWKNE